MYACVGAAQITEDEAVVTRTFLLAIVHFYLI